MIKEFRKPNPTPSVLDTNACLTKGLVLYEMEPAGYRRFAVLTHVIPSGFRFSRLCEGYINPTDYKYAGRSPRKCIELAIADGQRVFWVESLADIKDIPT